MDAKMLFEREDSTLVEHVVENGIQIAIRLPASEQSLHELARGSMLGFRLLPSRQVEASVSVEEVLAHLKHGGPSGPHSAGAFLHDERVRKALLASANAVSSGLVVQYAPMLAALGGVEALLLLETRRRELESATPDMITTHALIFIAAAELFIEPHRTEPALALLRALEDTTTAMGGSALSVASELSRVSSSRGEGLEMVRTRLDVIARECVDGQLARLAPHLLAGPGRWHEIYRRKLEAIPVDFRPRLLGDLLASGLEGIRVVLDWLPSEPDLRLALSVARYVMPSIPVKGLRGILRRALAHPSPSLRLMATALAPQISASETESLLKDALVEEPDPFIATMMRLRLSALSRAE